MTAEVGAANTIYTKTLKLPPPATHSTTRDKDVQSYLYEVIATALLF